MEVGKKRIKEGEGGWMRGRLDGTGREGISGERGIEVREC